MGIQRSGLLALASIFFIGILLSASNEAEAAEIWRLTDRDYPLLPHVITEIESGRGAGSFIKLRRLQKRNIVAYIRRDMAHGRQECLWRALLKWDDNLPEQVITGKDYYIDVEAALDRVEGGNCGTARIGVTFGSRTDKLRDRAPNVVTVKDGLADPPRGGIAPSVSTEIFRVTKRRDLPDNKMFTVAIHVSDGAVTDEVVALYVYEKTGVSGETDRSGQTARKGSGDSAVAGRVVRLQSLNYPGRFIRHRNFIGELTPVQSDLDRRDASFRIVPGLADPRLVSFESVNYPGHFLRHQGFRIKLAARENSDLFRRDATFRRVPGLADPSMVSFESLNYPGHFIRHRNFQLYLERGDSDLFRKDATFRFSAFGG